MRDDKYLVQLLDDIWDQHFSDVPQTNIVRIVYGRKAKNRLGSIRVDPNDREVSIITINGLFRDEVIPENIIKATIVHELSHYAHGFNSPLQQKFRHPHAGGVMRREFKERGLEDLYLEQRKWLKEHWPGFVQRNWGLSRGSRSADVKKSTKVPRPFWFRD